MKLLFPCHPLKSRLPDPDYEGEVNAAREVGFDCEFYNLELLRGGDAREAFKFVSQSSPPDEPILHRGWMMSDDLYAELHGQLVGKGYLPVVSPAQYAEAHYLPNAYPSLTGLTPHSVWMSGNDMESAWTLYQRMRESDALVKDFVKSAKHKWNEACFIPANTNRERFEEIIRAFLQARGAQFNKGIVFRRIHELVTLERDLRGQPVHEEYRMFFWRGKLLAGAPSVSGVGPYGELEKWTEIARRFQNPFISMDVARQTDSSFIIVEVGDGGVSGLPYSIEPLNFYREMQKSVTRGESAK